MALKSATYQFKGMNRDLSNMNASKDYAYEIRNMRITANGDNTLYSVSSINCPDRLNKTLKGISIGHCYVGNKWVIFNAGVSGVSEVMDIIKESFDSVGTINYKEQDSPELPAPTDDYIYLISGINDDGFLDVKTVKGPLGFSTNNPIEAISFIENEELEKIYWTDGKNLPRFITTKRIEKEGLITSNEIDFIPEVKCSNEEVIITKNINTIGMFPAGTTLYAFSYINYYGQQSNIFHISSIYYNVSKDKALEVNKTSSDSYTIEITNYNKEDYQYVRIYSIVRTSKDSTPEVRVVTDYKLEGDKIKYTDRHTTGYTIDPTELFYIGGELLVVGTMTLKDNTLFIGDITLKKEVLPEDIAKRFLNNDNISVSFYLDSKKVIKEEAGNEYYAKAFEIKDKSSSIITTFKMGDYYRFGVLLMHKSGRWSEPIYIQDLLNNTLLESKIDTSKTYHTHTLISAKIVIKDFYLLNSIKLLGYIKIRPLVVYPELEDRVTLCLGYLSPTVYNVLDRLNNNVWVLSSWFARPFFNDLYNSRSIDLKHLNSNNNYREEDYGALLEFRHNARVGSEYTRHKELLCTTEISYESISDISDSKKGVSFCCTPYGYDDYKELRKQDFFVDSSVVTMHSPEIEFNENLKSLDISKYNFRIIGYVPLTSHLGLVDIITSKSVQGFKEGENIMLIGNSGYNSLGLTSYRLGNIKNYSNFGSRILCSGTFYKDSITFNKNDVIKLHKFTPGNSNKPYITWEKLAYNYNNSTDTKLKSKIETVATYHIFPFHCSGDIYPYKDEEGSIQELKANTLQYKKLSNVRYSYGNIFLESKNIPINDCQIFNYDNDLTIRIKDYKNTNVYYKGNVDKIITSSYKNSDNSTVLGSPRYYDIQAGKLMSTNYSSESDYSELITLNDKDYSITNPNSFRGTTQTGIILMRYKSTPHIVVSFKGDNNKLQRYLPLLLKNGNPINHPPTGTFYDWKPFWLCRNNDYITDMKPVSTYDISKFDYSGLWLAELYLDINEEFIFGGTSTQAIANNKWNIAGESVLLEDNKDLELYYTEGDTYYQRYDNLKTYPWSMEEINGITDVISFMVETRINLEGRYDSNKADKPHFHILPSNFNLINKAYTQKNNFFEYYGVDYDRVEVNKYPNLISWSKTKTAGELTDTWLNLNLSSTLDLDGNCGKITSLLNYNGLIFAFLEKAINQILYNELTQISTTAGIPIEIANSGKVTGYRSISNQIGCSNKWSICLTPNGLYFLDSINKDLYKLGEGLNNLSSTNGFNTYLRSIPNIEKPWNPINRYSIKTSYDPINKEVLFNTDKETLSYSELLGTFMSFYDFKSNYINTIDERTLILGDFGITSDFDIHTPIYVYKSGIFNNYNKKKVRYYVEFIANPDPLNDKIFNVLEFRSDSWNNYNKITHSNTFNKLTISNEYQTADSTLEPNKNLKKRFRIWKALIPREIRKDSPLLNRIRNTWAKIKLESTADNENLNTVLHDITVHYSV